MTEYSITEARKHLSALIDRAVNCDEVIITRKGKPVVELRSIAQAGRAITKADLDWLSERMIKPEKPFTLNAAELISQMRDEDWR
jgi:prevent-host-death family protein